MDPDEIKIPVPMRDAQRIHAALGSLRRIAAIEANDEFVETLEGLMVVSRTPTTLSSPHRGRIGTRSWSRVRRRRRRRIEGPRRGRSLNTTTRACRKKKRIGPNY
jgi:hypothetical protein